MNGDLLTVQNTHRLLLLFISDAISPAQHLQKSSQHERACAAGDGAICSKNRNIVPYHGANPNTRAYGLRPRLWLLVMFDMGSKEFFVVYI